MIAITDFDSDRYGKKAADGQIFIGLAGQDPFENPVSVFTDYQGLTSIQTPLRLNAQGLPVNPFTGEIYDTLYVNFDYSVQIVTADNVDFFTPYRSNDTTEGPTPSNTFAVVNRTENFTADADLTNTFIVCDNVLTITLAENVPVNTHFTVMQNTTNGTRFTALGSDEIFSTAGDDIKIETQYGTCQVTKISDNDWHISGDIEDAED